MVNQKGYKLICLVVLCRKPKYLILRYYMIIYYLVDFEFILISVNL